MVDDQGRVNGQITLRVLADVYRIGLTIGYFGRADVIHWADTLVDKMETPPLELIEVSMTANAKPVDIASALMKIKGQADGGLATKIVMGLLSRTLRDNKNYMDIAEYLWKLSNAVSENDLEQSVMNEINAIDDAYYLAEQKIYGEIDQVHKGMSELLEPYYSYAPLWDQRHCSE